MFLASTSTFRNMTFIFLSHYSGLSNEWSQFNGICSIVLQFNLWEGYSNDFVAGIGRGACYFVAYTVL